jgi:hypothetical protein
MRLEYLLLQIILRRISTREEVMPDFNREALKRGCAADPAANDDLENAGTVATDALRLLNASILRSKDVDCTQSASATLGRAKYWPHHLISKGRLGFHRECSGVCYEFTL